MFGLTVWRPRPIIATLILSEGGDDFKREDETICGAANAPPAAMPAFLINSLLDSHRLLLFIVTNKDNVITEACLKLPVLSVNS